MIFFQNRLVISVKKDYNNSKNNILIMDITNKGGKKMKNGFTFISVVAFLLALIGIAVAIAAYFKKKDMFCCEDDEFLGFDDEDLDYYAADMTDDIDEEVAEIEFLDETEAK